MQTAKNVPSAEFIQAAAAFGTARSRTAKGLDSFEQQRQTFIKAQGERASLTDVASVVPSLQERLKGLEGERVTSSIVNRAFRIATDIAAGLLDPKIVADIAQEAEEAQASGSEAALLLQRLKNLERANKALLTACETLGDAFDEGEGTMANANRDAAPKPRQLGSFRTPRALEGQVKADSVASQLINTLDRLGLPHIGGGLSLGDDASGQLTRQLVRALDDQFETVATATGMRAKTRQRPLFSNNAAGHAGMSGRLKIDAQAIDLDAQRLQEILDGIDSQMRFQERDNVSGGAARTRRLIYSMLDDIRAMATSPQGIPARQANLKTNQLWSTIVSYLSTIGIEIATDVEDDGKKDGGEKKGGGSPMFCCGKIILPQGVTAREELESEVREVNAVVTQIHDRIARSSRVRSNAELSYRLQRSLDQAARCTRATLGLINGVGMACTLNLWESIDIDITDSAGEGKNNATRESLGNGMIDSLSWLLSIADRFVDNAQVVDTMTSIELAGLGAELTEISAILSACSNTLSDKDLDELAESVSDQVSGLAAVSASCAQFAKILAR
ncbi:MAG: hypothetical protein NWP98_09805 [Erythrobacter sp.]|nr:hypothetical protein [Erythrobacter sp.]